MLLDEAPAVATVGLDLFAEALREQAVAVTPVLWRPPLAGTEDALAAIAADPRVAEAYAEASRRLTMSRPKLVGIATAADVLGVKRGEFLHAGPPISWADASGPVRGALIGALIYEGLATTAEEAERLAREAEQLQTELDSVNQGR